MRSPRRQSSLRRVADVARASVVLLVAFGGYQAAASDGVQPSAGWIPGISMPQISMPDISIPDISVPGISVPDISVPDGEERLWRWRGVSAGETRTAVITIDESIYPVDGVVWSLNGVHDRNDLFGPLDEALGLWHSTTGALQVGDVVMACWRSATGDEHCPTIVVR